jgi:hypothetical protein
MKQCNECGYYDFGNKYYLCPQCEECNWMPED